MLKNKRSNWAATNLDMEDAIKKGKFREDLFYRLSTVEIKVPPLRSRKDDIHLLSENLPQILQKVQYAYRSIG